MTLVRQVTVVGEIYKLVDLVHQSEIHPTHLMNLLLKKSKKIYMRKDLIYPILDTWHGLKLIIQQNHTHLCVFFLPSNVGRKIKSLRRKL